MQRWVDGILSFVGDFTSGTCFYVENSYSRGFDLERISFVYLPVGHNWKV